MQCIGFVFCTENVETVLLRITIMCISLHGFILDKICGFCNIITVKKITLTYIGTLFLNILLKIHEGRSKYIQNISKNEGKDVFETGSIAYLRRTKRALKMALIT